MKSAINVSGVNPDAVNALAETILQILQVPHTDEKTKQLALKTIGKGVEAPSHISVSNCSMNMPENIYKNDFQQSRIDTVNTTEQEYERAEDTKEDS